MRFQTIADGVLSSENTSAAFDTKCDVLVIGLGTAGAVAAICAAENGACVIGVERTAFLGGMGTAACVFDYFYGTQGGRVIQINEECYRKISEGKYVPSGGRDIRDESLPAAVKDDILRKYALEAGCRLMLETTVIGVFMQDNTVCGAAVFDGKRRINIGCRVLIDGTEGKVCRYAGCEFENGRPSDGHTLVFSHIRSLTDGHGRVRFGWCNYGFPEADSAVEWTRMILDSTPKFTGERNFSEASFLGTREVPTVITEQRVTLEAFADGEKTDKPLFFGFSKVDNFNGDYENETAVLQDLKILCSLERYGITVGVPAGAMIPKGVEGLMVCSRAKGTGHEMAACLRMKFDMEKSGESAGVIAALACRKGCSVRDVPYEEVKDILLESGCLNYGHNNGFCDLNEPYRHPENGLMWREYPIPEDIQGIKKALSSREPGPCMWSLRCNCSEEIRNKLLEWLKAEDRLLAENSAVVLGMLRDKAAIPMLRDILSKPPAGYYYCVPKIKNILGWLMDTPFCNYLKAIILLGRFKDRESIPVFESIVKDGGKAAADAMVSEEGCPSKEEMAKKFAAFANAALNSINNN